MTRKRALGILEKRKVHLEDRIDRNPDKILSYDESEVAALEVAIRSIKREIDAILAEREKGFYEFPDEQA